MSTGLKLSAGARVTLLAAFLSAIASGSVIAMEPKLTKVHTKIERDFTNVNHIDAEAFSLLSHDRVIVFDVRGKDEYEVSHIEGAIRVDPDVNPGVFIDAYRSVLNGKIVIFYCSVGRRSSALASRANVLVKKAGATASYNLVGGLFHWHNEERPLMHDGKPTTAIHPYNFYWGRLILNKSAICYVPECFFLTL